MADVRGRIASALRWRRLRAGALLTAAGDIDLREHWTPLRQRGNSCTGFSRAAAVEVFARARGERVPRIDPYRAYWYARRRHRMHDIDAGTFPRSAWWAGRYGDVPAVRRLRHDYKPLLHPPPATDDLQALDLVVAGRAIYASGDTLIARITDSLLRRQPVQIGIPWGREHSDPSGPTVLEVPRERTAIGHAVTVVGIEGGLLRVANSYGAGWRDGGSALLSADYAALIYSTYYVETIKWHGELLS